MWVSSEEMIWFKNFASKLCFAFSIFIKWNQIKYWYKTVYVYYTIYSIILRRNYFIFFYDINLYFYLRIVSISKMNEHCVIHFSIADFQPKKKSCFWSMTSGHDKKYKYSKGEYCSCLNQRNRMVSLTCFFW